MLIKMCRLFLFMLASGVLSYLEENDDKLKVSVHADDLFGLS